jgi:chaperonin GroES
MARKKKKLDILDLYASRNICEMLSGRELSAIGSLVNAEFDIDKLSVAEWEAMAADAMDIAKQVYQEKSTPWEGAANVKYPLISNAAIQYAARAYPETVQPGKVVQVTVLGKDPTGEKEAKAQRVSDHMSTQLLVEDPEWESDYDRLLHVLPIVGLVFKKTYWDELERRNRSIMCAPEDIVVHRDIKSIETARRVSHILKLSKNDIVSGVRFGIYDDEILKTICKTDEEVDRQAEDESFSSDTLEEVQTIIEQHRWLDLDKDGYEEPYIVTIHKASGIVLRIYRCFELENVEVNENGDIWKIKNESYFTDFHFLPSPDGCYHSIGLGQLLLPINETINTVINQQLDAGTRGNSTSGFLARSFKTKSGDLELAPNEFKVLDVHPEDLKDGIFLLPNVPPSPALFQLLGLMIQSGKELAAVSDLMAGQKDTKDTAPTTVVAMLEQGLKVYSSIQKRLRRSLRKEFLKLYKLNGKYLDEVKEYKKVLASDIITKEDYNDDSLDILPISDPAMSSDALRLARARALMDTLPVIPVTGHNEIIRNWLEALQTPQAQIDKIIPPQDPNAAQQAEAQQAQAQQQAAAQAMMESELKALELQIKELGTKAQAGLNQQLIEESRARIENMRILATIKQQDVMAKDIRDHVDLSIKAVKKIEELNKLEEMTDNGIRDRE